jgi:hypothetical protein
MTATDDRLAQLRLQLAESITRLAELDAAAIDAVVGGKTERDISAIETRKALARDRIVLLGKAIKQLEHQLQLDAQAFMMRETMALVAPLTKVLDDGAAKLALPPHVPDKPVKLEPDVVKPKQVGKWFGNPKQGGGRWNERLR